MPEFERKQKVYVPPVLFLSMVMFLKRLNKELPIKVSINGRVFAQQTLSHEAAHGSSQPVANGIRETLLLAIDHFLGKPFLDSLLMKVFSSEALKFQVGRQRLNELHQTIIEKRHANFKRVGH